MNAQRRKELQKVVKMLYDCSQIIDMTSEEEEEAYYNMPEGLQESERGQNMFDNFSDLQNASLDIETLIANLEEIIDR